MRRLMGGLIAMALASAAGAQTAERLVAPVLSGYVLGHQAANADQSIREDVPQGETVQRWTRMVTTQRFTGLAARSTPAAYARTIIDSVGGACPGAAISPVTQLTVSNRAAARFQVDCPRGPETFILLAIAGQSDMHVKQVAFRGAKTAADLAWARTFLAGTTLCTAGSRLPACR